MTSRTCSVLDMGTSIDEQIKGIFIKVTSSLSSCCVGQIFTQAWNLLLQDSIAILPNSQDDVMTHLL